MTNELNNLPLVRLIFYKVINTGTKVHMLIFLRKVLKIELCMYNKFFRPLITPIALGSEFFEGLILLGISENNSNDLKFE